MALPYINSPAFQTMNSGSSWNIERDRRTAPSRGRQDCSASRCRGSANCDRR